jgi:hypothetical protein
MAARLRIVLSEILHRFLAEAMCPDRVWITRSFVYKGEVDIISPG